MKLKKWSLAALGLSKISPSSGQKSSMNQIYRILGVARILSLFAGYLHVNENGFTTFRRMKLAPYVLLIFFWHSLMYLSQPMIFWHWSHKRNSSMSNVMHHYGLAFSSLSPTDLAVIMLFYLVFFLTEFFMLVENFRMCGKLEKKLLPSFDRFQKLVAPSNNPDGKATICLLWKMLPQICIILTSLSLAWTAIFMGIVFIQPGLDILDVIPITIINVVSSAYNHCLNFLFLLIFGHFVLLSAQHCSHLCSQVNTELLFTASDATVIRSVKHESRDILDIQLFVDLIGNLNDTFERGLLYQTIILMTNLLFGSYLTISFGITYAQAPHFTGIFLVVSYFLYALTPSLQLHLMSTNAQKLVDEVQQLVIRINDSEDSSKSTLLSTNTRRFLDQFDGFSARGYFTVNKSMLAGMVSNYVTYLIVLVQFKLNDLNSAA